MLPTHHNGKRRPYSPVPPHALSQPFTRLRARSRFTNLAVLLLLAFTALSLLLNIRYILFSPYYYARTTDDARPLLDYFKPPAAIVGVPRSIDDVVVRNEDTADLTHLVLVAGHAVWNGCFPEKRHDENDWVLEPAQKVAAAATVKAFWSHIVKGRVSPPCLLACVSSSRSAEAALADESALLVFSGGQTRPTTPYTSEASSYLRLGLESNAFQTSYLPHPRVTTEDYSLDSFQNLVFSLARFREVVGRYPEKITVVGFGMKGRRFTELHRRAIRWPAGEGRWEYVGVDIEGPGKDAAVEGEYQYGYLPFTKDLYGCHSGLLDKRRRRNPHLRHHPFHSSAPELRGLLEWCPPDGVEMFRGPLPWDPHGEYLDD